MRCPCYLDFLVMWHEKTEGRVESTGAGIQGSHESGLPGVVFSAGGVRGDTR